MELIERYVQAVGERLHPSRRADVEAELRAAILDALEARGVGAESEDDVVAVLSELGAPDRIAAGYEPSRRFLIGPDLYPFFRRILRAVLVALVIVSTLGFASALMLGGLADFQAGALLIETLGFAFRASLIAIVVLVGVFAWLQHTGRQIPWGRPRAGAPWNPRSLKTPSGLEAAPRPAVLFGLVVTAVVLLILGEIGQAARAGIPAAAPSMQAVMRETLLPDVMLLQAAMVLSVIAHASTLIRGSWERWTRGARILAEVTVVAVFALVPVQLLEHRSVLLEAGVEYHLIEWLAGTAATVAAIMAATVAVY